MVVGVIAAFVRPQITMTDRFGPIRWFFNPVRAVHHINDVVRSDGCCAVAFAFIVGQSAFADAGWDALS